MIITILSILPMMVCLFWLAIELLKWKKSSLAQLSMIPFTAVNLILYYCHFCYFSGDTPVWLLLLWGAAALALYPSLLLPVVRLTSTNQHISPYFFSLFLPALSVPVLYYINPAWGMELVFLRRAVFVILLVGCWVAGYVRLRKMDATIKNYYADVDDRSPKMFHYALFGYMAMSVVHAIITAVEQEVFTELWLILALDVSVAIVLFYVFYINDNYNFSALEMVEDQKEEEAAPVIKEELQDKIAEEVVEELHEIHKEQTANVPEGMMKFEDNALYKQTVEKVTERVVSAAFGDRLERLMSIDKVYLRHNLKISDLAKEIGTNRTYLSQYLNYVLHMTFADYINSHRVNFADKIAAQSPNMKLSALAAAAGFSSTQSFLMNYKKFMGKEYAGR